MVTSREEEVSKVVVHVVLTLFALTFIFGFIKLIRLAGCKILHLATCCKRTQPSTPPPNRSSRTNPPNQRGDRRAQTEPRGLAGHVNRAIFNAPPGGGGERSLDRRGSLPQYDEIFQDKDGSLPPSYAPSRKMSNASDAASHLELSLPISIKFVDETNLESVTTSGQSSHKRSQSF